jgi:hypothetical protein
MSKLHPLREKQQRGEFKSEGNNDRENRVRKQKIDKTDTDREKERLKVSRFFEDNHQIQLKNIK